MPQRLSYRQRENLKVAAAIFALILLAVFFLWILVDSGNRQNNGKMVLPPDAKTWDELPTASSDTRAFTRITTEDDKGTVLYCYEYWMTTKDGSAQSSKTCKPPLEK